jgi:hypothetical protein
MDMMAKTDQYGKLATKYTIGSDENDDIKEFIPVKRIIRSKPKRLFSPTKPTKTYVKPYHDPTLSGYRLVRRDRDKNNQRDSKGFFVMY